jgi:hypothetical protein
MYPNERRVFVLQVEGDADRHSVHSVRLILKALTRRYGLRFVSVREELVDEIGSAEPERKAAGNRG